MQTTAIRTVANSLPENEVILLTLLISKRYIPYTDLRKKFEFTILFVELVIKTIAILLELNILIFRRH